jgi:magnesium transporter
MPCALINGYDRLLTSLLAAASARVESQQNLDVRKISAWVAIASVPTMLASIYGMNFEHMPELHWTWGYPGLLAATGTVCILLHRRFRHDKWL